MRNKILIASTLRNKKENATQADKTLLEADPNYANVEHSRAIKKACADAAKRMEDLLFTTGGAGRLLSTLKYFRDRPAIRELNRLNELSNNGGSDNDNSNRKNKTETLNFFIAKNLKGFLNFFRKEKGKGRRLDEDQNAYNAVMIAVVNSDLSKEKLGRILAREMGVNRHAVKRGSGNAQRTGGHG